MEKRSILEEEDDLGLFRGIISALMFSLILGGIFFAGFWVGKAYGQEPGPASATLAWDASTHYVNNDQCAQSGAPIPDGTVIEYTVNWRKTGAETWSTMEASETTATIQGLEYGQDYEVFVTAHLPGKTNNCPSDVLAFKIPHPDLVPVGSLRVEKVILYIVVQ